MPEIKILNKFKVHGFQWGCKKRKKRFQVFPWKDIDPLWIFMIFHGFFMENQWNYKVFHGILWNYKEFI
jgi:hypothetical protein